jgi:hypothetical protein
MTCCAIKMSSERAAGTGGGDRRFLLVVAARRAPDKRREHAGKDHARQEYARHQAGGAGWRRRSIKQPQNAAPQRTTTASAEREQRFGAAQLLHVQQRSPVADGVANDRERDVVAAMLAFGAESIRQAPDRGMVEEDRLQQCLPKVDDKIVSADMRQLVGKDRFELRQRQLRRHNDRDQQHGP